MNTFEQIKFDERYHTYELNGRRLQSVSKLLNSITPPFDRDLIAARTAAKMTREGKPTTAQKLIKEWGEKGRASLELGNNVHQTIAGYLSGMLVDCSFDTPELMAFEKYISSNPINENRKVEYIIGDAEMFGGIAGTVDLLYFDDKTGKHHLLDWKTGKLQLSNPYGSHLAPFQHLSKANFNRYSLQLGIYKEIIKKNTDLQMSDSFIVHLTGDGNYSVYQALDLSEDIKEWSKSYGK